MGSMTAWVLGLGVSIAALAWTAALKLQTTEMAYVHAAIAAVASAAIALASVRALPEDAKGLVGRILKAGTGLRYAGLVWAWGMAGLFITYAFVLQWKEWWHFTLIFAVLAAVCLYLSSLLQKDAQSGSEDETLFKLARILLRVHLGAAVITVIGLLIDGKMVRFLVPRHHDWAAQNIFFFGALALAAISWFALVAMKPNRN
jgi:hypothetical protein